MDTRSGRASAHSRSRDAVHRSAGAGLTPATAAAGGARRPGDEACSRAGDVVAAAAASAALRRRNPRGAQPAENRGPGGREGKTSVVETGPVDPRVSRGNGVTGRVPGA
eukprot:scaffold695_cov384-Prasinococcus_capsulatus_cf.AAC.23